MKREFALPVVAALWVACFVGAFVVDCASASTECNCDQQNGDFDTAYCDGKAVIVHLFEWKWTDVALECERFLAPAKFCAVQVSPPMEHLVASWEGYPWWQRYQPVSYKLESRSGSEAQFKDMVRRCNAVGVRIVVDAVFNHMAGVGTKGYGSGGTYFDADKRDFPGVPYSVFDFTPRSMCPSEDGGVHNYQDPIEVRNCYLEGLTDLYQHTDYVRGKISGYLNYLLDIGVMGFRIDAAKHMWPGDLQIIQGMVKNLNPEHGFPEGARPFFYHEVIDLGGEPITVCEYDKLGLVTEFRYCSHITDGVRDFRKIGDLYNGNMACPEEAFVFVDNHDNQRDGYNVLTYKDGRDYRMAVVYTLAQDYGFPRVMSSYFFSNKDQGPPGNGGQTADVVINADGSCSGGWVCEHRYPEVARMVQFRNAAGKTFKDNWNQWDQTVAFSRGSNAFFAMQKWGSLDQVFQTGMAAGEYCDIITNCAKTVRVLDDGTARIVIDNYDLPYVAICRDCGPLHV